MTTEISDFPYGHGQNDHFGHDHNTIFSSNDHGQMQMVKINRYFNNFNKFGMSILTIEPQFGQNVQQIVVMDHPPPQLIHTIQNHIRCYRITVNRSKIFPHNYQKCLTSLIIPNISDPANFARAFGSGYLLGELMSKYGLQDDFKSFSPGK
jgi:hypothetical protein